jgi:hypothetical protein
VLRIENLKEAIGNCPVDNRALAHALFAKDENIFSLSHEIIERAAFFISAD